MSPDELTADLLRRYAVNQTGVAHNRGILRALGEELGDLADKLASGNLDAIIVDEAKIATVAVERPMVSEIDIGGRTLRQVLGELAILQDEAVGLHQSVIQAGLANVVTSPL